MNRLKASNMASVHGLVVGLLLLGLPGCSLQKRTTLPGWHREHEKTAIRRGPMSNAEAFVKDRGHLVNLAPRGTRLQLEVDLCRTLQVSGPTSSPKHDVEAMPTLVVSKLDRANRSSTLMLFSADAEESVQNGAVEEEPNDWLIAALITLVFGLMMLPSPAAGVFIGLAPFLFSLGQLVRISRMEEADKKKSQGKTFGHIVLMLASVFVTIGLTTALAVSAAVDAAQGIVWPFSWAYTGPG